MRSRGRVAVLMVISETFVIDAIFTALRDSWYAYISGTFLHF